MQNSDLQGLSWVGWFLQKREKPEISYFLEPECVGCMKYVGCIDSWFLNMETTEKCWSTSRNRGLRSGLRHNLAWWFMVNVVGSMRNAKNVII